MPIAPLRFDRAQYATGPGPLIVCSWCGRGMQDSVYRANGAPICSVCADRAKAILPRDTQKTFWRAVGVGFLTACSVSLAYFILVRFLRDTLGFGMGFGAIGVGYGIGKAMRWTARGAGGRRYQIAAALLTYAAISIALTGDIVGLERVPMWAYPLLALGPIVNLFLGQIRLGLFEIFFAFIGIRWAWGLLRPHVLKITGPEQIAIQVDDVANLETTNAGDAIKRD
jgi:hypothetical protein